ncbi:transposase domain-containing protein, partial [Acinetobacter indicus]
DYCVPSAAVQARQRLGREPLAALFSLISQAMLILYAG